MSFKLETTNFRNEAEWRQWRQSWREGYNALSQEIRRTRHLSKYSPEAPRHMSNLRKYQKPMAWKMLTLLEEAKKAWALKQQQRAEFEKIVEQYPLTLENCREVIFHFNKAHNQNPDIPPWVVKAKGKTFYVHNLTSEVGFTTRERPDDEYTKGAIRFRKCNLAIDATGHATITKSLT
jgi:alkyl sulfatase BDS1-like metallo-beta-lactamase superfamily hydrolase